MTKAKCFLLGLAFLPVVSMAADKHVHGEAQLFIAIEGNQLLIEFESPADNILGFEHTPNTASQKARLKSSLVTLADYTSLAEFPGGACKQVSYNLESPFEEHHETEVKDEDHSSAHNEHEGESHKEEGHEKHDEHEGEGHEGEGHKEEGHEEHDHAKGQHDEHEEEGHTEFTATYTLHCDEAAQSISTVNLNAFKSFNNIQSITVNWVNPKGQGSAQATPTKKVVTIK